MKKHSILYIIIAGILWGTSGLFVDYLAPYGFSSLHMVTVRGGVSLIVLALYVLICDKRAFCMNKAELLLFACSGLALFGTAACYYAAIQVSSVSTAVILMYTAPVIVMIYSVTCLGETFTLRKGVCVACMIIGCTLVSGIIGGLKFSVWGIALGLLSSISFSAYNIFTKIQMQRKSNPVSATLYCFAFMTLFSLCVSKPMEIPILVIQKPFALTVALFGLAVVTALLPYLFYTLAMKTLPAGTASALAIVEPMSATLFSVIFLNEALGVPSFIGIILILASVYLLSRSERESGGDVK